MNWPKRNELTKVHGGAQKVSSIHQDLDVGTTCAALIPYLKGHDLTVYTHGMHHITELNKHGIITYLLSGLFKPKTYAVVGALTLKYLEDISFDIAFTGFNGYDKSFGFLALDEQDDVVTNKVIERSNKVCFLADKTKFGSR